MHESRQAETISARDFVERELRANPDTTYVDLQAKASRIGINVQRFLYGSMRRSLGLPPRPDGTDLHPAGVAGRPDGNDAGKGVEGDAASGSLSMASIGVQSQPAHGRRANTGAATGASTTPVDGAGRDDGDGTDVGGTTARPPEPATTAAGAPAGKGTAFAMAVETLRMSPDISYQDLRLRASMAGLQMPPIVYGRAKALLGLVPTKPRRPRVEPPRMLRQVDSADAAGRMPSLDGIRSLEQLVATVRALENERQRLRAALAAILDTVDEALRDE